MEFLVISYAIGIFFLTICLLGKYGKSLDIVAKRKKYVEGKGKKRENYEELDDTFYNRFIAPTVNKINEAFAKINQKTSKNGQQNQATKNVERQLRLAGMDISAEAFLFYKQWFMAVFAIITVFIALLLKIDLTMKLLIIVGGLLIAIMGPKMLLQSRAQSRQNEIRLQLPDALDLMGVCIEAGLSFDASLLKVSEKIQGPFIDELLIVYREIQMGVPRNEALKRLADGSDIQELKTFISALIQANQLGIPINNVMAVQSAQLRDTRKQRAKEEGAKAPIKILIPMVLFIFPVIFIILMGPTVMNIMETFS